MFSGLTNQVSSWMGAVRGEHDEDVPQPTGDEPEAQTQGADDGVTNQAQAAFENVPVGESGEEGEAKATSPTKTAGMFSNMKTQVSGWLPAIPSIPAMPAMPSMPSIPTIPGLKKHTDSSEGAADALAAENVEVAAAAGGDDDEDRSRYISATEGADSRPASGPGTPSDEKAGQVGMVTTKVTQGAKTFGSFLYSAVNKAGDKIKETVKHNNILGEFSKEQEAFIKGQQGAGDGAVPWAGHQNEEKVKEEILGLSSDRRNFVRAPPAGVDFEFNYDVSYPVAVAIMAEDSALEKMRFDLVPKIITEENFWRNYFYRVSLICQASDLGTLGTQESDDNDAKKSSDNSTSTSHHTNNSTTSTNHSKKTVDVEFVSDTFQTTEKDLEEVKAGMKILGIDTLVKQQGTDEEQWEKELDAELQEYEVVQDGGDRATSKGPDVDDNAPIEDWEKDVDDLLGDQE